MDKIYKRVWLSPGSQSEESFVSYIVDEDGEATLRIGDCYRRVEIDFSCYGKKKKSVVASRKRKLDRLVRALLEFQEAWEEANGAE